MATTSSYRLPGVYSNETTAPFVNIASGGNAVVAFIGPALGYSTASQQAEMTGFDPVALDGTGVIEGGVSMTSRVSGASYVDGADFVTTTGLDGVTTVQRVLQSVSLAKAKVTNRSKTFYVVEPEFDLLVDANGMDIDGYLVCGTVKVVDHTDDDTELVEGIDYVVAYAAGDQPGSSGGTLEVGWLRAMDQGALADANGHVLHISFEWTTAEPIKLVGESAWTLDHKFIAEGGLSDGTSINIVCCAYTDGEESHEWGETPGAPDGYQENIDFVLDYQTGRISATPSTNIPLFNSGIKNYMYVEFAYDAVRDGEPVVIEYKYQEDTYGQPEYISSYVEATRLYGPAWNSETGAVSSELSLAAYIAFQNGLSGCYMVSLKARTDSDDWYPPSVWEEAFDALTYVTGIDIIVPLTGNELILDIGRVHLAEMKNNQDERVMLCGLDGIGNVKTVQQMIAVANRMNSNDVWLVGPSTVRFRNPIRSTVDVLPGYYLAAAVAGYNSSVPQYMPLTRKAVSGFYSANEYATKVNKTNACQNGVMYIDEVNGQLRVLHGTSTDPSFVAVRETNVTLTKYFIIKRVRNMFENGYIGEIITDTTIPSIRSNVQDMLMAFYTNNYIMAYDNIAVEIDENNPTQINVSFRYVPVYGINYIQISFQLNTTTGNVSTESY